MSAHREHARLLMAQGRNDLAEQSWRMVLSEEPDDGEAHASLALCLLARAQYDAAEAEARSAIGADPADGFAHYVMARVLQERHRHDEATTAIAEAIRCDPDRADFRAALASIASARERWADCLEAAEAGLAIDPTHVGCANLRALALRHLGRREEAAATLAGVMARSPDNSLTHANQGWTLLHAGRHREAQEHFREALRLDPDSQWAREGLLTALKARNPLYRLVLGFFLFMSRLPGGARMGMIIGIYLLQNGIATAVQDHPEYGYVLWPLLYALLAFVYLTWLANPLMNLAIRLHPLGRHALTPDQRWQSFLVGMVLLATAMNVGWAWSEDAVNALCLPLFVLAIPVSTIHVMEPGWPRQVAWVVSALFAVGAVEIAETGHMIAPYIADPHHHASRAHERLVEQFVAVERAIMRPYFIAILAWSFVGPQLARVQPRR
jgi:tetratricopeptide (TPR) repeat protein